jgi:Tfp pilus assembly protein PilZ
MDRMSDRAFPRYALEAAVTLRHQEMAAAGRTRNMSRGGLCAQVSAALPAGAQITVEIALIFDDNNTSEQLELPARVVWSTPLDDAHQVGLGFLSLSSEQARYLDLFLRYLAEASPSRPNAESDHADLFTQRRAPPPRRR